MATLSIAGNVPQSVVVVPKMFDIYKNVLTLSSMTKQELYDLKSLREFRKGWQSQGSDLTMEHRVELARLEAKEAIHLGKLWAVNAALTGKPRLARYYTKKVVALQATTPPPPHTGEGVAL